MNETLIHSYFCCPACKGMSLDVAPFEQRDGELVHAVVRCAGCAVWYRLEDGVLELLVPALREPAVQEAFRRRFASRWDGGTLAALDSHPSDGHKLEQKRFFDDDAVQYETKMVRLPFWQAFDSTYLAAVARAAERPGLLVEIGGGTGRMSLPIADRFSTILSFDISEVMVRRAIQNRQARGTSTAHAHYFLGDAENIPLRPAIADVVSLSGILHHVENPSSVIREMDRILKPGGAYVGNENNRSAGRFVFDWLMRLNRLWKEKAHEHHFVISERQLREWFNDTGLSLCAWTSVFLPPHLFNVLSPAGAERLLGRTDALARAVPWLRGQGGLILYSGKKPASGGQRVTTNP